ncbi:hypothetical protein MPH_08360 [Macrophomina phaseolina MS6]|uniref:Uncharacterized protein n=1 Tax=Macrophomina phaseolina (strain MS6) TaxID=1126212 RepID=K2QXD0_MACPH|nr:hypothetical protein MPH_08360 [Macrophomina phaseolina MS6]
MSRPLMLLGKPTKSNDWGDNATMSISAHGVLFSDPEVAWLLVEQAMASTIVAQAHLAAHGHLRRLRVGYAADWKAESVSAVCLEPAPVRPRIPLTPARLPTNAAGHFDGGCAPGEEERASKCNLRYAELLREEGGRSRSDIWAVVLLSDALWAASEHGSRKYFGETKDGAFLRKP